MVDNYHSLLGIKSNQFYRKTFIRFRENFFI